MIQLTIDDYLNSLKPIDNSPPKFKVGDKIGWLVLGDVQSHIVTAVEGWPGRWYYRTDSGGCIDDKYTSDDFTELERRGAEIRSRYKTIELNPYDLEERVTLIYPPRECDGRVLKGQIGIYRDMLFWEEKQTYQFLEPFRERKELTKAYREHIEKMTNERFGKPEISKEPIPIKRMYYSRNGFYAEAAYVRTNG